MCTTHMPHGCKSLLCSPFASVVNLTILRTRYNPISMSEFNATIHSILFKSQGQLTMGEEPNIMLSQRLSVMFMVLAIGSLMDVRLPSYNIEAEKYHQLARAALFQNNIFDEPTLGAVQALYLMSFYLFLSDKHGMSGGSRWAIMGMAVKLAQSVSRFVNRRLHWILTSLFPPRSDFVSCIANTMVTITKHFLFCTAQTATQVVGSWTSQRLNVGGRYFGSFMFTTLGR